MKIRIRLFTVLLMAYVMNHVLYADYGKIDQSALSIPLVSLIVRPERYDKKLVHVYGQLSVQGAHFSIALHSDVIDMGDECSTVLLDIDCSKLGVSNADISRLNRCFVAIQGVVVNEVDSKGNPFYPLKLTNVNYIGYRGKALTRSALLQRLNQLEGAGTGSGR